MFMTLVCQFMMVIHMSFSSSGKCDSKKCFVRPSQGCLIRECAKCLLTKNRKNGRVCFSCPKNHHLSKVRLMQRSSFALLQWQCRSFLLLTSSAPLTYHDDTFPTDVNDVLLRLGNLRASFNIPIASLNRHRY